MVVSPFPWNFPCAASLVCLLSHVFLCFVCLPSGAAGASCARQGFPGCAPRQGSWAGRAISSQSPWLTYCPVLRHQLLGGWGAQGGTEPGVPEARWPLCSSPPASYRSEGGKVAWVCWLRRGPAGHAVLRLPASPACSAPPYSPAGSGAEASGFV